MYKSKRWLNKRENILRRDQYLCQENLRYGRRVQADTVHHIFPVEYFPDLAYVDWNLISLSHEAHNAMHDRSNGMLTDKGKYWTRQRRRRFEKWKEKKEQLL